jgi:hypothetical protein
MLGVSRVAAELMASRVVLSSIVLVEWVDFVKYVDELHPGGMI